MEKQRVSLFRQKNRWGLTVLSIALCVLLSPALSMALFLPQILTFLPVLLLVLLGLVGPVSAGVCCAVLIGLGLMLFGGWGAVSAVLFFVPVVIVSAFMVEKEREFWMSAAAGAVAMFVSMGVVMGLTGYLAGSDVVTAISGLIREIMESSLAVGDTLLVFMAQLGMISMPENPIIMEGGLAVLDAATHEQMLTEYVMTMDASLRLEIPMQMATGAIAVGLLGQAVLRRGILGRGVKVEYPPLRTWHVPGGWGRVLGGTLAVLYLFAQLMPARGISMFYVFAGVFDQVFTLQGIAALCWMLHKHGKGKFVQGLVFAAGYFLLSPLCVAVGIADQTFDFTHRRETFGKEELNLFGRGSER